MGKKLFPSYLPWIVVGAAAVAALGLAAVVLTRVSPALPGLTPSQPITLWASLVAVEGAELTVVPALAPPDGADRAAAGSLDMSKVMTVVIPRAVTPTADYYAGDVLAGARVLSEPLRLDRLRTGTRLWLTIQPSSRRRFIAIAVSWPQSTTLPNGASLPPVDIKIPPPISPP